MKALHMKCGRLVIYHMKLESGTFRLPYWLFSWQISRKKQKW